jgi:hypothetical protein
MAGRTPTSVTSVSRNALTAFPAPSVAGDVTNGNVSSNDGATMLAVLNSDGAATHVLTVQVVSGVDGLATGPRSYTIPTTASGTQLVGPFPIQFYGSQLLWNVDSAQLKVAPYSLLGP